MTLPKYPLLLSPPPHFFIPDLLFPPHWRFLGSEDPPALTPFGQKESVAKPTLRDANARLRGVAGCDDTEVHARSQLEERAFHRTEEIGERAFD